MGDPNTPLLNDEKIGGASISEDSKKDLSNMINSLGLMDLDLNGARFTWSNRSSGSDIIKSSWIGGSFPQTS